jgi:hypothetical protein
MQQVSCKVSVMKVATLVRLGDIRCKSRSAKIGCAQCDTTWNGLIRRVDVEDAVFGISDPDDLGHCAVKWRFGGVAGFGVDEVPGRGCLGSRPVVLCFREQCFVLFCQYTVGNNGCHTHSLSVQDTSASPGRSKHALRCDGLHGPQQEASGQYSTLHSHDFSIDLLRRTCKDVRPAITYTLKAPKDSDSGTAPPSLPRRYKSKREGAKESFLRLVQLLMEPGLGGR